MGQAFTIFFGIIVSLIEGNDLKFIFLSWLFDFLTFRAWLEDGGASLWKLGTKTTRKEFKHHTMTYSKSKKKTKGTIKKLLVEETFKTVVHRCSNHVTSSEKVWTPHKEITKTSYIVKSVIFSLTIDNRTISFDNNHISKKYKRTGLKYYQLPKTSRLIVKSESFA